MPALDLPRPVAFVLGGGGSLGAAHVGMLQALEEVDVAADMVIGTSVGSLNGAVLAENPRAGAHRLTHAWEQISRDDVFPGGAPGAAAHAGAIPHLPVRQCGAAGHGEAAAADRRDR